ncbi:MAG TPA: hypothetical protein VN828_15750 [Acidobacteriaceae bacterium]|nr:hypothetical protein [Acidobacteriaceae bacterium]
MTKAALQAHQSRSKRIAEGRGVRVEVTIPKPVHDVLEAMVRQGWARSKTHAVAKAIMAQVAE